MSEIMKRLQSSPQRRRRKPRPKAVTYRRGAILGNVARMKVIGGDADTSDDALRSRVCAEFIEMPGLQLTFEQATRLWGIEPIACRQLIDELVACGFLKRTPSGRVMRADRH